MKKFILLSTVLLSIVVASFGQDKTKMKEGNMKMKVKVAQEATMANMMMPYKADYSSNFRIGNQQQAKMVLQLWKDYDENNFDQHSDWFADTVVMLFPNGSMAKGKAAVLDGAKQYRNSFSSVTSTIDAWIPVHSNDRNEDWVTIWGIENDTDKSGKTTQVHLQEIWRFNKDGKIDFMKQFIFTPKVDQ